MSGDKYYISAQHNPYFITCTVVDWIDLFTRREYKDVLVDSLNYCTVHKGLVLYGWVLMTNHLHIVGYCEEPNRMSDFLRDFKKHTSKQLLKTIQTIPESRREWMLDKFSFEAKRTGRAENYKIWKDDNHAIDLSTIDVTEKLDYMHKNPVRTGIVENEEEYLYSRAKDYAGKKSLVNLVLV
jgi:putative transposase